MRISLLWNYHLLWFLWQKKAVHLSPLQQVQLYGLGICSDLWFQCQKKQERMSSIINSLFIFICFFQLIYQLAILSVTSAIFIFSSTSPSSNIPTHCMTIAPELLHVHLFSFIFCSLWSFLKVSKSPKFPRLFYDILCHWFYLACMYSLLDLSFLPFSQSFCSLIMLLVALVVIGTPMLIRQSTFQIGPRS